MNKLFRVSPLVFVMLSVVWASSPVPAETCRVLILSPSNMFPAADIADQLKSLLEGSGTFSKVEVIYRDIVRDVSYATSLLSVAYVPPYRTDHIAAIQQGSWTHVVMIDRPFLFSAAPELHYVGVNAVSKIISAAGAQPVLMMPWVDRSTIDGYVVNNSRVREIAYRVGDGARDSLGRSVPVVPAGVAWSTLDSAFRGTLSGQPVNGVALNTNGKYSAAASLFTFLTGQNAKGVDFLPAGLASGVRDAIADHASSVHASEISAARYTGEFQSVGVRFWEELPSLPFSAEGTSTEEAIADQLKKIAADDGKSFLDTRGIFVKNASASQTAAKLVFGRNNNISNVSAYDVGTPITTMVAGFDRQGDTVSNGPAAAVHAEVWSISLYRQGLTNGWNFVPYHLLWVRTMYDLNIPIDPFSVHAPDWQFSAVASALYTQRMNGKNGIYPATAGLTYWSPQLRTERFAWQTGQMAWQTMHEMATLKPAPPAPERPFGLNRIVDAESYLSASRDIERSAHAVETFQLDGLGDGDWTSYAIDFGNPPPLVVSVIASVASTVAGASIEVREGSAAGVLLGTIFINPGTGPNDFIEARGFLSTADLSGVREVFLVYRVPVGAEIKVDHFRFSVQARASESVWVLPTSGVWESASNWLEAPPSGVGSLARFSLDIPGGLPPDTVVTMNQLHVLTTLELGHGVGTTGGILLQNGGSGALEFQSASGHALIRKTAGGDDAIGVAIQNQVPLQIRNQTNSLLSIRAPISGQEDVLPSGRVNFSGTGYDVGRLGFSTGMTYPANVETAFLGGTFQWTASGTVRNFYLPQHTVWTIEGGELTNLGWTEIGNDDTATSGGNSTLTINGGIFRHASSELLRLGHYHKASSFINLNGGVFETQTGFTKSAGAATVTFNGGLLRYSGGDDVFDFFSSGPNSAVITRVGPGGAHFEIAEESSVTIGNVFSPVGATDGGVRKSGPGTLVLTGSNTFKGPVVVESGELIANNEMALGASIQYTVRDGATLSLPGSGGIAIFGTGSGWSGSGTVNGGIYLSGAPMDLTEGTLSVSDYVTLINPTISVAPRQGLPVIEAAGELELGGSLTLNLRAPEVAIPAGGQVTLISGSARNGTFSQVLGSNLWSISYTDSATVMTALVNIPGVVVPPVNHGAPAIWGDIITLTAVAGDVVGVAGVEFYANGRLIGQGVPASGGVYTFHWNLGSEEAQTFAITTRVTNVEGVMVESPGQSFTVNGLSGSAATWTNSNGGSWSVADNWLGGEVADNYDEALFDSLDIPEGSTTVDVDSPRTLAKLSFRDLGSSTIGTWVLTGELTDSITLSGGAAEIFVAPGSSTEIATSVAAPGGFKKSGEGTLVLSVPNPGLLGSTKVTAGVLSLTHPNALGASTVSLSGGALSFPSAITICSALRLDSEVLTTMTFSAPVTWSGDWRGAEAAEGATLRLWSTSSLATINLSNTIDLPGMDLEIAGLSNSVNFSGNVTVRNFKFYGRTGSAQGNLDVIFSGSAVASCSGSLTTINDGRTTNIRINDQAQLTLPGMTTSARNNFYLNGGVLTVRKFPVGTHSGVFANGGILRPMANDPEFMFGINNSVRPLNVQAGGLKVDTNGFDIGMIASIVTNANPDGGVTKMGAGTMTVDGSSVNMTWRGATRVQGGTLRLGSLSGLSTNSRVFEIAEGATLDIASSTTPTLSLTNSNNTLSGGGTLVGGLSISAGTVSLTAGQPLQVSGNASLGGGTLSVGGTLSGPGDFVLLTANQVTGSFVNVGTLPAAPPGFSRELVYESNRVLVRVSGPGDAWLAANAASGARFSDEADGNGRTLLETYVLGKRNGSNAGGNLSAELSDQGNPQMHFSYNTVAVDATIEVEFSHDLITWTRLLSKPAGSASSWTPHVAGAAIQSGMESGGIQQAAVTAPVSAETKTFFRMRVLRAE